MIRIVITLYCCISLLGCTTASLLKKAAKEEDITTTYRITSIRFAALQNEHVARLCLNVEKDKDKKEVEVLIDLSEITTTDKAIERLDISPNKCDMSIHTDERLMGISELSESDMPLEKRIESYASSDQVKTEVALLKHDGTSYLLFKLAGDEYKSLARHAYNDYDETTTKRNTYYLIALPITLAADALIIAASAILVVGCVIFPPMCIPAKIIFAGGQEAYKSSIEDDEWDNEPEEQVEETGLEDW